MTDKMEYDERHHRDALTKITRLLHQAAETGKFLTKRELQRNTTVKDPAVVGAVLGHLDREGVLASAITQGRRGPKTTRYWLNCGVIVSTHDGVERWTPSGVRDDRNARCGACGQLVTHS